MNQSVSRSSVVEVLTPRASRRARLALAATIWSAVGLGLFSAGTVWLIGAPSRAWIAGMLPALAVGWLKARFLLRSRADDNATRIVRSSENRCIGGAFSWSAWVFAIAMVGLGVTLRHSPLPRPWLGLVYCAVGFALFLASLRSWSRLREVRFRGRFPNGGFRDS